MKKKKFIVQLLNSKKPSRTSFTQVEDANFYSNDTDASLVFIPHEDSFDFQSAKVVMFNRGDESLVERDMEVTTEDGRKVASYELPDEIISHWGQWIAQPVFINDGEVYSGAIVPFSVDRHLMHERPPKLTEVVTVTKFVQQSQELVNAMIQAEAQRITEEQVRQSSEENRVQAESERSDKYESYAQQFNDVITELSEEKDYHSLPEIAGARGGENTLGERLDKEHNEVTTQLAQTKKRFLNPQYIEFFGSFNRFGIGTPTGVRNYDGGNYVLIVSGNAGDSFVTVESGNIVDAGNTTRWACVIENNDGLFDVNQVTSTDGVSKINLLDPLENNISSKRLGNLHDSANGQHYTELGYFAFAQHMYNMPPRHAERNGFIAQFKPTDTTSSWKIESPYALHNASTNMTKDNYFRQIGKNYLSVSVRNNISDYAEWEESLSGEKGYLESYIGVNEGTATVSFHKDGVLSETITIGPEVERVVFDYDGVSVGKIKIVGNGPYNATGSRQAIYIGLTTWWVNEKIQDKQLIDPNDKVVYIGDSWGEYHDRATTRELERLMIADGGTPTVLDYSKGGHTSTYARVWFDEYVIKNNPKKVIIQYFTNDFNSIGNSNEYKFINPDGQEQDMKINSLDEYVNNIIYMVERAIENGIQPIVIMPASTDSETQTQKFANYAVQLWLGNSTMNKNPSFDSISSGNVATSKIESIPGTNPAVGSLPLVSKQVSSSIRKGVVSDTDTGAKITNGDIHGFYNNGERVAGFKHDGGLQVRNLQLEEMLYGVVANEENRGSLFLYNGALSNNEDELRIIVKRSDGTYGMKKIQLID